MELKDKIDINKKIRQYNGVNSFVLSLQKQLKTNKYLNKVDFNGKMVKILSDRQYETVVSLIS
jgi:hypothetical protein